MGDYWQAQILSSLLENRTLSSKLWSHLAVHYLGWDHLAEEDTAWTVIGKPYPPPLRLSRARGNEVGRWISSSLELLIGAFNPLLVYGLVDWLFSCLIDYVVGLLVDWLIDSSTDWFVGWLTGWLFEWLMGWWVDEWIDWDLYRPVQWLMGSLGSKIMDWAIGWLTFRSMVSFLVGW